MTKLRILKGCITLDYPDGFNVTTRVLVSGGPEGDGNRRRNDNRNRGQRERERGLGERENSDRGKDRDKQTHTHTHTHTGRGRDLKVLLCWISRLRKEPQAKECRMQVTSESWAGERTDSP